MATGERAPSANTAGSPADRRADHSGEAGFTLVELLVVLAIIALVATLVGPRVLGYVGSARADTAAVQVRNIANALELYYLDAGRYPDAAQGLSTLVAGGGAASGPYLRDASGLQDPWGRPYGYESDGSGYRVVSLGRDGVAGGSGEDADIEVGDR